MAALGCTALDASKAKVPPVPVKGLALAARPQRQVQGPVEIYEDRGSEKETTSPHDLILPLPSEDGEADDAERQTPYISPAPRAFRYDIPIVRNAAVERWIEYFTGPGRERFKIWLERGGRYVALFRKTLAENQLPKDLAYLSLIESGFNPRARSRAGATGAWQFIRGTARRMGLKVNYYVDERRDPEKSVQAAAAYLKFLYKKFGDWHLALAAYNAGENRIQRVLRKTGKRTYWAIARTRHLSAETRNYVPKFIAGLIIAKNPNVFGFANLNMAPPLRYEITVLPRGMSLRTAARLAQVPLKTLWDLNTELRWKLTPPRKGYPLHLPIGRSKGFFKRLARAPIEPFPVASRYRIQRGDTFGAIARRLNIPLRKLMELNPQIHPRRLRPGIVIMLAQPRTRKRRNRGPILAGASPETMTDTTRYRIQPGDTLGAIASRHQVPLRTIIALNPKLRPRRLRPGTVLKLGLLRTRKTISLMAKADTKKEVAAPSHHIVGRGESIWVISRKYGIPMKEVLRLNRLSASSVIFPGDRLRIRQ